MVTWCIKKQLIVSRSSAEAEYRAMAQGICEGLWLKRLLGELKVEYNKLIHLFGDNQAAINIAKNPIHHDCTKNVEIDKHFISEKVEDKIVSLIYTPTHRQVADILTKSLHQPHFNELKSKLGMYNMYIPAWEC